jgi:hypothetical protein
VTARKLVLTWRLIVVTVCHSRGVSVTCAGSFGFTAHSEA